MQLLLSLLFTTMAFGGPSTDSQQRTENDREIEEVHAVLQESAYEVMHLAGRYFVRTPVSVYELDLTAASVSPLKVHGLTEVWALAESGQGKVIALGRTNGTTRLLIDIFGGDVSDLPLPSELASHAERLTLAAGKTAVALASKKKVFWWNGKQWSDVLLAHAVPSDRDRAYVSPHFVADSLFVALNEGEWAAGLFALDTRTKKMKRVCAPPSDGSLLYLTEWRLSGKRALLMETAFGTARLSSLTPAGQCRTLATLDANFSQSAGADLGVPHVTGMDLGASNEWVVLSGTSGLFHQRKGQWRPMVPGLDDSTGRFGFQGSSNIHLSHLRVLFTTLKVAGDLAIIGTDSVGVLLVDMKTGQIRRVTLPLSKKFM
ncbi:hypothetical protein NVS55_02315 [Myxococcus stipitatus]|uniref:hypothetical protein n=1 Tax=Myxococcus stipitatus TaxID=83455 RepID=UPI003144E4FC